MSGLEARTRTPVALDAVGREVRPDLVHAHTVVNPAVLEWAAGRPIEVVGWLGRERLAAVYRRARALLMPSRWQEPFGIAGLEALTLGVPVVAWESGGVSEWHPGPLGAWGDVSGLARALRQAVGTRAVAPAGFDRRSVMRRLVDVYQEAARAGRAALAFP